MYLDLRQNFLYFQCFKRLVYAKHANTALGNFTFFYLFPSGHNKQLIFGSFKDLYLYFTPSLYQQCNLACLPHLQLPCGLQSSTDLVSSSCTNNACPRRFHLRRRSSVPMGNVLSLSIYIPIRYSSWPKNFQSYSKASVGEHF